MEPISSTSGGERKSKVSMDLMDLRDNVRGISKSSNLQDIRFYVGLREVEFSTTKTLVAACSEVFKIMLFDRHWQPGPGKRTKGSTEESPASDRIGEDGVREIKLPKTDPKYFEMFLKFVSAEEVEMGLNDIPEMLDFAKMYDVGALVKACLCASKDLITKDNALLVYNKAMEEKCEELVEVCLPIICRNGAELLRTKDFTELDRNSVQEILKRDDLAVEEIEIFEALQRWAKEEHTRDEYAEHDVFELVHVLKNLKYCLRPTEMSQADFVEVVGPTGLFSARERLQILEHPYAPFTMPGFCTTKRQKTTRAYKFFSPKQEFQPVRICNMSREMIQGHPNHVINYCRFKLSRDADLSDIEFNGSSEQAVGSYEVDLVLTDVVSSDVVLTCQERLAFSYQGQILRIRLRYGDVVLKGNTWYLMTFDVKGPPAYYQEYFVGQSNMKHFFGGPEPDLTIACDAMERLGCEGDARWSQLHSLTFNFSV